MFFFKIKFFQLSSDSDESESEFSLSDSESSSELSDRRSLLFLLFFFSLPFSCLFASPDAVVDNAADAEPPAAAPDVDDDEMPPDNGLLLALFSDVFDNESNGNAPALESDPAPAPPLELVVVVAAFDAAESLPDVRCCFEVAK